MLVIDFFPQSGAEWSLFLKHFTAKTCKVLESYIFHEQMDWWVRNFGDVPVKWVDHRSEVIPDPEKIRISMRGVLNCDRNFQATNLEVVVDEDLW